MIYFKKIKWKNLLSTGNTFTEVAFDKHKTTLIVGENEDSQSGKPSTREVSGD